MSEPGKYAKGIAKQEQIVDVALNVVAGQGYDGATIREVAAAAGLSKTGLLHHFPRKEDLFSEVLRRRDEIASERWLAERDTPTLDSATLIADFVRDNAEVPGLVQLFTRLSSEATDPAHPAHEFFRQRYEQNRAATRELFADMVQRGELPSTLDPDKFAVIIAALEDGLQLRWLYDRQIDMAAHIAHLFEVLRPTSGEQPL